MRYKVLILAVLLLSSAFLNSGISRYYTFAYTTAEYNPINGIQLSFPDMNNYISSGIEIGFPFPYCGQIYEDVKISTNGFINPGANWNDDSPNNQLHYGIYPIIAPLWDDLSLAEGSLQYATIGTAPNREFWVQYSNARWLYNNFNCYVNFQVVLSENGKIEFRYGNTNGSPLNCSASIGINMPNAGAGNFFSITPGNPPTVSTMQDNYTINEIIPAGTVYIFNPLPPVLYDLSLKIEYSMFYTEGIYHNLHESFPLPVTVKNNGTETVDSYDVVLYCGLTELCRLNGISLAPADSHLYDLVATIDSSGWKHLTAIAELPEDEYPEDNIGDYTCIIRPNPNTGIIVGSGDELQRIPIDVYWKYSLYETIYYAEEIGNSGTIYGISYYMNSTFSHNLLVKIWVGATNLTNLNEGWIAAGELTPVFNSYIIMPPESNEVYFPFSTPYQYQQGNLCVMVYHSHTYALACTDPFLAQTVPEMRALKRWTDAYDPDPYNPPVYNELNGKMPKTAFYLIPDIPVQDEYLPQAKIIGCYPNPFKETTTLQLNLDKKQEVCLEIYNIKGQKVQTLFNGLAEKGETEISWNGLDNNNRTVANGLYFCKLKTKDRCETAKLIVLK